MITPYCHESFLLIERCHKSCLEQTVECTHFLVSDGHPIQAVGQLKAQHIALPCSHDDYGNTPRAIGALSAINQGFNPIFFLDADNWWSPVHVENALAVKVNNPSVDVVASYRHLVLSDGTIVEPDPEDVQKRHIDTSCLAMFESSFFLLPLWATMTKPLSVIGDRVMFSAFRKHRLAIEWTNVRSLFYFTNYPHHWARAGKKPPSDAYILNTARLKEFSREQFFNWSGLSIELH